MNNSSPYSLQSVMSFVNNNFAVLLIAVVFFAGGFFTGTLWNENQMLKSGKGLAAAPAAAAADPAAPVVGDPPALTDKEHVRGNKNAKVTLIEYSDFECPFCARFHPTTKQVLEEYGDKVKLVYRHYPLDFHPNAQKAAEASECVAKLGGDDAFWKFADSIFAENDKLGGKISPEAITAAIAASGVNATQAKSCLDAGEFTEKVKADMAGGATAGVQGTPGTFILAEDGTSEFINGAQPYESVKASLDKYVK